MKKKALLFQTSLYSILLSASLITSCNNSDKKINTDAGTKDTVTTTTPNKPDVAIDTSKVAFDIQSIPVTTKDIGIFPYLKAPEDYKYNDISKSELITIHFAVKGRLIPVEGKAFSTNIYKLNESGSSNTFNTTIVQRSYDKAIKELGGVQVSDKLLTGEIERIGEKILEPEGNHAYTVIGANDFTLNHLYTYVIRTEKAEVWIELSLYQNGGYIHILEKANP